MGRVGRKRASGAPYVSVGMPVFNGERFLPRAVETLLSQDFEDFELVVSDNCSTDGTVGLLTKYADLDPRVRVELHPKNRGAAWNYNRVLELADRRARYFCWAAADDEHAPDYLSRTVAILDADPSVVLAHTGTADIDEDGFRLRTYHQQVEQLTSADPATRIRDLVSLRHECFQAFGLIRQEAARATRGLGAFSSSDQVLLVELAFRGRFVQDDAVCFFRRQHTQRSVLAYSDERDRIAWFDPAQAGRRTLPTWRIGTEMIRAIRLAPLTASQRVACYRSLDVFLRNNWAGLVKNLAHFSFDVARLGPADDPPWSEPC